ncbi:hypothetical protein D3C75_1151290 [compost metagenome]
MLAVSWKPFFAISRWCNAQNWSGCCCQAVKATRAELTELSPLNGNNFTTNATSGYCLTIFSSIGSKRLQYGQL